MLGDPKETLKDKGSLWVAPAPNPILIKPLATSLNALHVRISFVGFFSAKQSLKNRSTIFSLGNRGNVLAGELEEPIIVPHAAQKSEKRVSIYWFTPYLDKCTNVLQDRWHSL